MTTTHEVVDQAERQRALDPELSCIVQAPAGSGKTGLLTQRYLTLLARVNAPEEIVALTFTRKAASEMRSRILGALQAAQENKKPASDHEQHTWDLAAKVLRCDQQSDWQILSSPRRLRIQTIDSFVSGLNRQMPILSGFGSTPIIVDNAESLYRQAAQTTIAEVESGQEWSPAIERLMHHLDNQLPLLEGLIVSMLRRRDHWLRHIANAQDSRIQRGELEACLQNAISQGLAQLSNLFPQGYADECLQLTRYAAENIKNDKTDSAIAVIQDMDTLPGTEADDLPAWHRILGLLLTNKDDWRKTVTIRNGFPKADKKEPEDVQELRKSMKARHGELVKKLSSVPGLLDAMRFSRILPKPVYDEGQWQVLTSLFELLRLSVAQLHLVFRETGQVDHTAMMQGALQALGPPDNPTDLALSLDYRIQHLLIDEFQDTSLSQYELIERLTAGWQPGDGRSLFLVGDPMQSIYRFREAEVGLFLKAMDRGFNDIKPEALTLRVNFRSQQHIVDWVNQAFPRIMPQQQDIANGAIAFSAATAFHDAGEGEAVTVHPFIGNNKEAEAHRVIALIQQSLQQNPDDKVAVLVRSRSHLSQIAVQLKQANLRFQALEIEPLSHRPVIQDLLALTFALTQMADRVAWFSILRAPWCGLVLDDLYLLASRDHNKTIWSCINDEQSVAKLGTDGQKRLIKIRDILRQWLPCHRRTGLRSFIEGSWIALGGPACLDNETDLEDAQVFFKLLAQHDQCGALVDRKQLTEDVNRLFALADVNADDRLQLMTIHKAKGLEFDTVIVPGLGKIPRSQEGRLLMWMERPQAQGGNDLMLAPIREYGAEHDSVYNFLKVLDQQKDRFESTRLLYVAATRARTRLHLLGHVEQEKKNTKDIRMPDQRSLLYPLWPVVEDHFRQYLLENETETRGHGEAGENQDQQKRLQRLPVDWQPPAVTDPVMINNPEPRDTELPDVIEYSWAGQTARCIGSAVHRLLQHCQKIEALQSMATEKLVQRILLRMGMPRNELNKAVVKIQAMIEAIRKDDRGRWILSDNHFEIDNEYALSGLIDGRVINVILDRTFVDSDDIRWIIDYKTGTHSGTRVDEFLDREQERYRLQLERYASLMRQIDDRPIRMGLYFPSVPGWREWGLSD